MRSCCTPSTPSGAHSTHALGLLRFFVLGLRRMTLFFACPAKRLLRSIFLESGCLQVAQLSPSGDGRFSDSRECPPESLFVSYFLFLPNDGTISDQALNRIMSESIHTFLRLLSDSYRMVGLISTTTLLGATDFARPQTTAPGPNGRRVWIHCWRRLR